MRIDEEGRVSRAEEVAEQRDAIVREAEVWGWNGCVRDGG
jgi:hypothetical protein